MDYIHYQQQHNNTIPHCNTTIKSSLILTANVIDGIERMQQNITDMSTDADAVQLDIYIFIHIQT